VPADLAGTIKDDILRKREGVVSDESAKPNERPADDLIRGAEKIGAFIGLTYYEARRKRENKPGAWPIGKDGKELIASRARLTRHAHKLTSG
jgi:hypothetical protein